MQDDKNKNIEQEISISPYTPKTEDLSVEMKDYIDEKLALKWMLDKDDFAGWFFENYKEQEGAVTSIKELYKDFKYSSTIFDKLFSFDLAYSFASSIID